MCTIYVLLLQIHGIFNSFRAMSIFRRVMTSGNSCPAIAISAKFYSTRSVTRTSHFILEKGGTAVLTHCELTWTATLLTPFKGWIGFEVFRCSGEISLSSCMKAEDDVDKFLG